MAFYNEMLSGAWDILKSPFVDLSALWFILPLIILWLILEIYFDLHSDEELGWNTALGNSITMFWMAIQLMRFLFTGKMEHFGWLKITFVIILFSYSIFLAYISFTHKVDKDITFHLASPTTVYYWSGIVALWVYGSLAVTLWIFIDIILLFLILLFIVSLSRKYGPFKSSAYGGGL
ncbi:MAG: hypothetical protein KKE20_06750 [Nanoarchaeota archaeon]|nr:hypothetical protein [Nanoarchaeota archaeon]